MSTINPINSINPQNYAMNVAMKQNEPVQEEYSNMPMVYESVPETKKSSSNLLGMTLLGVAGIAGGYIIGKRGGKAAYEEVAQKYESLVNSEAVKNYDKLKNATNEISKVADNYSIFKPTTWGVSKKVKNILKPLKDDISKTTKEAADDVAKAADDATKAVDDSAKA